MYGSVKRLLAFFLCITVCMTSADIYAVAAETDNVVSGSLENETEKAADGTVEPETDSSGFTEPETDSPRFTEPETEENDETADKTEAEAAESSEAETVEISEPETTEMTEVETTQVTQTETLETEIGEAETLETETMETETFETETTDEESEESVSEILSELQAELDRQFQEDGYCASGYIDSGFEADRLGNAATGYRTFGLYADTETLPAAYSAVEAGQVSAIRNQGGWGTCWAFAAMATAESAYKKLYGSEADLSETHLVNFFYHDGLTGPDGGLEGDKVIPLTSPKVMQGGNNVFTAFALARWTGAADEALDSSLVYPLEESYQTKELTIADEYAYKDVLHMQNAYWLNKNDRDSVKRAVMDKGVVSIYYKYSKNNDSRYVDVILEKYGQDKYEGPAVYYYEPMNDEEGHGVAIVGWDDNFDRNNFAYTFINQQEVLAFEGKPRLPKENGAWLVKNSWGSGYGDDGYFWMSYEDASLSDTMLVFDFEKADNYDHIYQYDGAVGVQYQKGDEITAAAVYKSTGNQMIEAAGIGIASVETDYTVEVYTDLTDVNNPQSGRLCSRTEGTTAFQGYHTIELDEYVVIPEGSTFSIVVTLSGGKINDGQGAAIFVDQTYDNGGAVRFVAKTNSGETFVKAGDAWKDAAGEDAETKVTYRIKAYTTDGAFNPPQENVLLTTEMVKEIDAQEFNGIHNEPPVEIRYMGEALVRDVDFQVVYFNNDRAADRDSETAPKAVITGIGKYAGTVEQTFTILPKEITEEMAASATMLYNGAVQDDLVIHNDGRRLVKGTDYTITFDKEPRNAGTYTASITGVNNYAGELNVPVTITKAVITEEMVIAADGTGTIPAQEYTGTAVKPTVRVLVNGIELPADSYSVSYKNNINTGTNATITVTGKGQCQGKVTKTFAIMPRSIEPDCAVTVAKAVYSGKVLTPTVTVKRGSKTLKKGKDYTLSYEKNTYAADMSAEEAPCVTVTGIGNYTGKITQPFTIQPKEIAEGSISVQIAYDEAGSRLRVTAGKEDLDETQYRKDTLAIYKAGTGARVRMDELALGEKYDIEIALCGNYRVKSKDTALKKNVVSKRDINALNIRFADENAVYTYNAKTQKPKLVIQDAAGNTLSSANYTLTYSNNVNAGKGTAIVTVTGKGAYAGTRRMAFTIEKKKLENTAVQSIKDQTYTQKEICPTVRVLDGKKALKAGAGKDYTVVYGSNVNVAYDENGSVTADAYAQVLLSDNYEMDETAAVMHFKIVPASISSVTLSDAYYTGSSVLPDKVTVKAGKLVVPAECYDMAAENNTAVSTKAALTVTAKAGSNYKGSKTKKFRVVKQELKKLVLPVIPDQPYLNQPVTFAGYPIKDLNGQDIGTDQYDITFKNNKKPGKASVTYKAKSDGLYKGSATVRFNITKATMAQAIDYDAARAIEKPYTGSEITLTDEELRQLAPIKDAADGYTLPYTAAYSKNISAGTAVVCLTGTDYLQGSKNMYFTITPKSVETLQISTGTKQLKYNDGQPVYLELKEVRDNGTVLRQGKDYICSYANAAQKGIACLTITGVGSYTGTRYIYYSII
ncbi:MAG: hypothetical protein K2N73_07920 [Lachnospiraceae bacterium]|nr:hypothetical protein [Lachnospiraceae bacterium]